MLAPPLASANGEEKEPSEAGPQRALAQLAARLEVAVDRIRGAPIGQEIADIATRIRDEVAGLDSDTASDLAGSIARLAEEREELRLALARQAAEAAEREQSLRAEVADLRQRLAPEVTLVAENAKLKLELASERTVVRTMKAELSALHAIQAPGRERRERRSAAANATPSPATSPSPSSSPAPSPLFGPAADPRRGSRKAEEGFRPHRGSDFAQRDFGQVASAAQAPPAAEAALDAPQGEWLNSNGRSVTVTGGQWTVPAAMAAGRISVSPGRTITRVTEEGPNAGYTDTGIVSADGRSIAWGSGRDWNRP